MSLSRITTEKVKERADIEEVVSDYLALKKRGQNLWACCPFHNEKSPSFSVSPAKQIYKCFGCGKAGDPIQFVMDIEGIGFAEAIKHLAKKYGIEIEEDMPEDPERVQAYNERESLYIALGFARDFFVKNLTTPEGLSVGASYFQERGFNRKIIRKFDLGYSLEGWDHLLKEATSAGFAEDILLKAGLILEKEGDSSRKYDRFRGRAIFTIHNLGGKPIAFGARTLKQDKKQPKYINSPETAIYHKGEVLYGMYQAKQAIRQQDNCYLVEGYTDVLSMHLSGIENVVASSGTSLTENQIKLIKRFTNNVTVLYDGDAAGIKASLRGIDMLLEGGLNVKAVVFPDGNDPDSYARKVGAQAFTQYLSTESRDFIAFKIDLFKGESGNDPAQMANLVREVIQSIAKIPDPISRSVYVRESSRRLQMEEGMVLAELNKILLKGRKEQYNPPPQTAPDTPVEQFLPTAQPSGISSGKVLANLEREMLRLLINFGFEKISGEVHVCDYLLQEIGEIEFQTPVYQRILTMYQRALQAGILPNAEFLLSTEDTQIKSEVAGLMTQKYEISVLWEKRHQIFTRSEGDDLSKTVYNSVLRLKRKAVKKMLDEAKLKIKEAEAGEVPALQTVYMELKQYQIEIDRQLGTVISY